MVTTVRVHDDTWERLNDRKGRGESMDDIIRGALDTYEKCEDSE